MRLSDQRWTTQILVAIAMSAWLATAPDSYLIAKSNAPLTNSDRGVSITYFSTEERFGPDGSCSGSRILPMRC
jgi:hypothetical protein